MVLSLVVYTCTALVMAWLGWHVGQREQHAIAAGGKQLSLLSWEILASILIYVVVSALRWQTSWDYNMYYNHYVAMQSLGEYSRENFEPGFSLVTHVFGKAGMHFAFYFAFWALVQIVLLFYALRQRKVLLPWLALCIFLGPYYIFWMGFIRQSVVEALFVVMVELIVRRKFWWYLLLSLVAVSIHKMCVLFIPLYVIPLIPASKAKRWLPFALLALCIALGSFPQWIRWIFDRIGQMAEVMGYGHYHRLFMSHNLEYAFRSVIGPARLFPLLSCLAMIWFYPGIKSMFEGDKYLSATYRFALVYMGYINLFANTTQYLARPGELMRTCFVIMLCYLLYYLWRKRLWWAFAVIAVSNFYYVYYEIAKSVMIGGSIYQPELYHTFLF
ncbi:MAG: EpsG family protein [Muribaculaceae bacterium]|nr:EpsG family protein [Muribaculaceae bacterium]